MSCGPAPRTRTLALALTMNKMFSIPALLALLTTTTTALQIDASMLPTYQSLATHLLGVRASKASSEAAAPHWVCIAGGPGSGKSTVAAAVALRNIELLDELDLVGEHGARTARYFQAKLKTLDDHPLVGETRGVGLLGAMELVKDKHKKERFSPDGRAGTLCRNNCFNTGVVMRAVGDTMFLCPPLVITEDEIDALFDLVRKALDKTAIELGV